MSNERICAEINLSAISYNMESMHRNLNPGTKMIAVIKTDGYGHGAGEIAEKISKTVRTVQRALDSLRDKGYIQRVGSKQEPYWEVLK